MENRFFKLSALALVSLFASQAAFASENGKNVNNNVDNNNVDNKSTIKDNKSTIKIEEKKNENSEIKIEENPVKEVKPWSFNPLPFVWSKTTGFFAGAAGLFVDGVKGGYKGFVNKKAVKAAQNKYRDARVAFVAHAYDAVKLAETLLGQENTAKLSGKWEKVTKAAGELSSNESSKDIVAEALKVERTELNAVAHDAFINALETYENDVFAAAGKVEKKIKVEAKDEVKDTNDKVTQPAVKAAEGNEEAFKAFADFFVPTSNEKDSGSIYKKLYDAKNDAATALFRAKHWIVTAPITYKKTTAAVVTVAALGLTAYALLTKRQIPGMSTLTRTFGLLFSRFASKNVVLPQPKLA